METFSKYNDIMYMPHHRSASRPHMSAYNRAAQFSPFAALTGHDEMILETARLTDQRIEPDEDMTQEINQKLCLLKDCGEYPVITVEYFVPDGLKAGGAYVRVNGEFKRICEYDGTLIFTDGRSVPIKDIYRLDISF